MAFSANGQAQKHFMILFDSAVSPNNQLLAACSTYGDIFVWNMSSILDEKIKNKCDTKKRPLYDDDDEDDDLDQVEDNDEIIHTEEDKDTMYHHLPSFVFRPFPKETLGAIYRLHTVKNLLFVATFEALYIYKWNDIMDCIAMHANDAEAGTMYLDMDPMHKYIAPQIEYAHGAKSRYVEINAIAGGTGNTQRDSVFLGTGNCSIFEFDLNKCALMNTLSGHKDYVLDLSTNDDYNLLSSSSNDGTLKVWDINNHNNEMIASFNDDDRHGYYANCGELHSNGRYIVSGFTGSGVKSKKNKICLFELHMKSLITELVLQDDCDYNYSPQVVKFSNAWRPSTQSNLSIVVGFNHDNLHLFDRNYTESNLMLNSKCAIQTSSKSIWSINISQNVAIVCGTSNKIDLIANTANVITSLSVDTFSQ